jgi:phosphatidylserine decarboxylase
MEISYVDRKSGQVCIEKVYGEKSLSLLYGSGLFKRCISSLLLPLFVKIPLFSRLYGYFQKSRFSAKKVTPFIRAYGIDASEFRESEFASFNDFFIRKLKTSARPIAEDSLSLAAPADGRYFVYPRFSQFSIKGKTFSLESFLQDSALASQYLDGSMVIVRLCPVDYHRFHFPSDGIASKPRLINGYFYSVNPIALKKRIAIFSENKRVVTEIQTEAFGKILYVEIGATAVASICQTFRAETSVKKGEEKGYFEFGGSCIVLLFEKGRIEFDSDLLQNTKKGLETLCRFGESIARASLQ